MNNTVSTTLRALIAPALALGVAIPAASAADSGKRITLKGEVDSFSTADIDAQEHGLVRIKLANGRSAIIDVGSRQDVQQIDIEQGDHVRIKGTKRSIDGTKVVSAQRLQVKEQGQDSQQTWQPQLRRGDQGVEIQGTIQNTQTRKGRHGEATLVTVKTDEGKTTRIVIPPHFDLERIDVEDAEKIRVRGIEKKDKGMIVSQRLRIDGQEVQRQRMQSDRSQQRQRMQRDRGQQRQRMQRDRGQQRQTSQRQQQDRQRQQQQQRRQQQDRQPQQQDRQMTRLQGTVESFSKARLKNAPEDNVFVKVTLEDGSSRVVDFGPVSKVKLIRMQPGDEVKIEGMVRKLNDRKVLEARSVTIQSEQRRDRKMMRSGLQTAQQGDGHDEMMLQGTVEGLKKVRLQGDQGKVSVMKIKLQDGTSRIVNLSPWLAKEFLDIEPGDKVVASGHKRQASGRTIGIVDSIVVLEDRG